MCFELNPCADNVWLHGEGRNRVKMSGDVLIKAAWQAIFGEGAEPEQHPVPNNGGHDGAHAEFDDTPRELRSDILALFIRAVSAL